MCLILHRALLFNLEVFCLISHHFMSKLLVKASWKPRLADHRTYHLKKGKWILSPFSEGSFLYISQFFFLLFIIFCRLLLKPDVDLRNIESIRIMDIIQVQEDLFF